MKKLFAALISLCLVVLITTTIIYMQNISKADSSDSTASNITISIKSAAVEIITTSNNEVTSDYDNKYYKSTIVKTGSDWSVEIYSIKGYNKVDPVKLYIPDIQWGDIKLNLDSVSLDCKAFKTGKIDANFAYSSVNLVQPKKFSGSLNAVIDGCNLTYTSEDNYKNCDVTILCNNGMVDTSKQFVKKGNKYTYSNGTKNNKINITLEGYGYNEIK